MPGHEARLLRPEMTQNIVNQGLDPQRCAALGTHLVQSEVTVQISVSELLSLHFGVCGFTGAGKSNLVSTLVRQCLNRTPSRNSPEVFKVVLFDLMDEYTGLLIDQLVRHQHSRLIVAGREAVDENLLRACEAVAQEPNSSQTTSLVQQAARSWAARITLPAELRAFRDRYVNPLSLLIRSDKVVFYESWVNRDKIST
jgi:DNA helicase HerA-like ATPase